MNYATAGLADKAADRLAIKSSPGIVVCGSFRRDPEGLRQAVGSFAKRGCRILSPTDIDFVDDVDGFVVAEHERDLSPALIEEQHLRAMISADLIWLFSPDGYVGSSAAMELGYAHGLGIPVYCRDLPNDIALAGLVVRVSSPDEALSLVSARNMPAPARGIASLQHYYRRTAQARGWAHESPAETIELLQGEINELIDALAADNRGAAELELADVQLYLVHLANSLGVDLADAVIEKEAINAERFAPAADAAA